MMRINERFLEAVHSCEPVTGYTHDFYRYPARFSPLVIREAIRIFTEPGETVLDPFMGGGTSIVEAHLLGRKAVGSDINGLAVFLAKVKTTLMSDCDLGQIHRWAKSLNGELNLRNVVGRDVEWIETGYQRNIGTKNTWPIRKLLELALGTLDNLQNRRQRQFARCVLLKSGQWALDCRKEIPTVGELRARILKDAERMAAGARAYAHALRSTGETAARAICLHRSALGLEFDRVWQFNRKPKLIVTSPPYPGIHVLYHRWQIRGRRETPAPFWIAGMQDGCGASFYTFGDRKQHDLTNYFARTEAVFKSLAVLSSEKTVIIQIVAFSDPLTQLPRYLDAMTNAGLAEIKPERMESRDGRIWRGVPNRKWYASQRGEIGASKEVVLFHRLQR